MGVRKAYIVIMVIICVLALPVNYVWAAEEDQPGRFELGSQLSGNEFNSGGLIVKPKVTMAAKSTAANALEQAGEFKVLESFASGAQLIEVPLTQDLQKLKKQLEDSGQMEYVEYDYKVKPLGMFPNDTYFKQQWSLLNHGQKVNDSKGHPGIDIDVVPAWHITQGNPEVIIAVIDTGVDVIHPEIADQIWTNQGEIPGNGIDDDNNGYTDDANGYDFFNNDNTVYDTADYDLHGTYLTSIIAARHNNGVGIAGAAPGVTVMPLKFIGGPQQEGSISGAIKAIEYARSKGAQVCNLSWGGPEYSQALRDTIANCPDMLFIAAAGNEGVNIDDQPVYPAAFDCANIITVTAIDNKGQKPEWANYGTNSVDIAAPGLDVIGLVDWPEPQPDEYLLGGGTSSAAPQVSAIAGLLWSKYPSMSIADIKNSILLTAKPLPGHRQFSKTGGLADAFAAFVRAGFIDVVNCP